MKKPKLAPSLQKEYNRKQPEPEAAPLLVSIRAFCTNIGISRNFYFVSKKRGEMPETVSLGRREFMTPDAILAWRAGLTRKTAGLRGSNTSAPTDEGSRA